VKFVTGSFPPLPANNQLTQTPRTVSGAKEGGRLALEEIFTLELPKVPEGGDGNKVWDWLQLAKGMDGQAIPV